VLAYTSMNTYNVVELEFNFYLLEFDDEHPLNESSLVPDFPQSGYPIPLKISPSGKKFNVNKGNFVIMNIFYNRRKS
jgi:hypothetical protein